MLGKSRATERNNMVWKEDRSNIMQWTPKTYGTQYWGDYVIPKASQDITPRTSEQKSLLYTTL